MSGVFAGIVFAVDSGVSSSASALITSHGGNVKRVVTDAVKFLITTREQVEAGSAKADAAAAKDIPIVKEEFLSACVTAGDVASVNTSRFLISVGKRKAAAAATTAAAAPAASTASSRPTKRAAKRRSVSPPPAAAAPATAPPKTTTTSSTTVDVTDLVDASCGLKAAGAVVLVEGDDVWDYTLSQIDLSKNMDKYYIGQVLKVDVRGAFTYYAFFRWGRSGTRGQCQQDGPFSDVEDAKKLFLQKYREKTANDWPDRASFRKNAGKYNIVRKTYVKSQKGKWQYFLAAPQDGKAAGWHDYDASASDIVEDVYEQWQSDATLNVRCVQSGRWMYKVEFDKMTQTNIEHFAHTSRSIRRVLVST